MDFLGNEMFVYPSYSCFKVLDNLNIDKHTRLDMAVPDWDVKKRIDPLVFLFFHSYSLHTLKNQGKGA